MFKWLILAFIMSSSAFAQSPQKPPPTAPPPTEYPPAEPIPPDVENVLFSFGEEMLIRINNVRLARKLPLLFKSDPAICAAGYQAAWLSETNTCNHIGRGKAPLSTRLKLCGEKFSGSGEVVACGYVTAQHALDAWLKSPGHAKIILNSNYTAFGAGFVDGQWVVVFTY